MQHRLQAKGFDPRLVDQALEALANEGVLSDERFVTSFIHTRTERGYGPQRIRAELRERGIGDELIETHLDERAATWPALALRVYEKKYGPKTCDDVDVKERARRIRFLQYRGFTGAHIRALFEDDLCG